MPAWVIIIGSEEFLRYRLEIYGLLAKITYGKVSILDQQPYSTHHPRLHGVVHGGARVQIPQRFLPRGLSALADRRIEGWPIANANTASCSDNSCRVIVKLMPSSMSRSHIDIVVKTKHHVLSPSDDICDQLCVELLQRSDLLAYRREQDLPVCYDLHKLTAGTSKTCACLPDTIQKSVPSSNTPSSSEKDQAQVACQKAFARRIPFKARISVWKTTQLPIAAIAFALALRATVWAQ